MPPTDTTALLDDSPAAESAPPPQSPREFRAGTVAVIAAGLAAVQVVIAAAAFATESIVGVFVVALLLASTGIGVGVIAWRARDTQPWRDAAAIAALVLAMIGSGIGGGAVTFQAMNSPAATPDAPGPVGSASVPAPNAGSGTPPQPGERMRIVLPLSTARPPRAEWSATTGGLSTPGDIIIECRKAPPDIWESCVYGDPAQYRLVSPNGGRIAAVGTAPTEDRSLCAGAQFQSGDYVPIDRGQHFCVQASKHLIALTVESLPPPSSDIEVTLLVTVWPR